MDSLRLDLRYAIRSLSKRPGFTGLVVLTLALGLGVNTVAFSAIDALLLRQFHLPDGDRIGWLMMPGPGNGRGYVSPRELATIQRDTTTFEGIHGEGRLPVSWRTGAGAEQAWALLISSGYLHALGVTPVIGRLFTGTDLTGSELPALVSERFWTENLGKPASISGQRIVVNGRTFSVVGVLDDGFQGPGGLFAPDMWLPLERIDVLNLPANRQTEAWLTMFGRLKAGATPAQAEAELTAISRQLGLARDADRQWTARFHPMRDGHPDLGEISGPIWMAFGLVGLVLLIACFNVAALLMARAAERQREISVRCAVGASRARILRQLVTEGLLLAGLGGAAALIVAAWSGQLLSTFALPAPIPQRLHLGVDRTLVLFTAFMALIAGVLPAVPLARQATRTNLLRAMRAESAPGARRSRTRNAFVVAQVAGSTLFIVGALLFVRSFLKSSAVETGFDTARTAVLQLAPSLYGYDEARSRGLFEQLQARLETLPGVGHVGLADRVPFYVGQTRTIEYSADGTDCSSADCRRAALYAVGPGHFSALGVPLIAGGDFTPAEAAAGAAVIISAHMAAQLWPGVPAVGQLLRLGEARETVTVAGVAADITHRGMGESPGAYIYRPLRTADYAGALTVIVGATGDPRALLGPMREQLRAIDPDVPPASLATMTDRMKMPLWAARTSAGFFVICGSLAMILATIGLFGVMYFSVSQRTREFGIRAALGATRGRVMSVVLGEGLRLALPGVVLGGVAGYLGARLLARALFGITPADPVTFAATAAIEIAVTLAACALPAYHATKADPVVALRADQ